MLVYWRLIYFGPSSTVSGCNLCLIYYCNELYLSYGLTTSWCLDLSTVVQLVTTDSSWPFIVNNFCDFPQWVIFFYPILFCGFPLMFILDFTLWESGDHSETSTPSTAFSTGVRISPTVFYCMNSRKLNVFFFTGITAGTISDVKELVRVISCQESSFVYTWYFLRFYLSVSGPWDLQLLSFSRCFLLVALKGDLWPTPLSLISLLRCL